MTFETNRLILRNWCADDAEDMYRYASHPDIGPSAGWTAHKNIEESRAVIRDIMEAYDYAVVLKELGHAVGGVSLRAASEKNSLADVSTDGEVGCWIGVPFWGHGLIPEAILELIRYGFDERGMSKIWYGYFDGNEKSRRVAEKCGFEYSHTAEGVDCPQLGERRTEHFACIARDDWNQTR